MGQFAQIDVAGWKHSKARIPGWLRYYQGSTSRYKAPNGVIIGEFLYRKLYNHYRTSGIVPPNPEPDNDDEDGENSIGFFLPDPEPNVTQQPKAPVTPDVTTKNPNAPRPEPKTETPIIELPEAIITPGKKSAGKATAKELQQTFAAWLGILTSMLAMVIALPEANMTEVEVKAISIPIANLFERSKWNEQFGKAIVGSNDYVLLGYALYSYTFRVNAALQARKGIVRQPRTTNANAPSAAGGAANGQYTTGYTGVGIPYSPTGLRGITGTGN